MRVNTEAQESSSFASGAMKLRKLLRLSQLISELKLHEHPHKAINISMRPGSYLKPNALNIEKIVLDCSHVHRKEAPYGTLAVKREVRKFQCLRLKKESNIAREKC